MKFQFTEKSDNWLRDMNESKDMTVEERQEKVDAEFND